VIAGLPGDDVDWHRMMREYLRIGGEANAPTARDRGEIDA